MGSEVDQFAFLSAAKHPGVGKTTNTRADFYRSSSCVIQNAPGESPAVGAPYPAGDRSVDEGDPEEDEDHGGHEATSFSNSSHQDCYSYAAEFHLEEGVEQGRDQGRTGRRFTQDVLVATKVEISDEPVGRGGRECQGVTPDVPGADGDRIAEEDGPNQR